MSAVRRVLGIDAGYVNFAVCYLDVADFRRPLHWTNAPLFTGTFSEQKLAEAIYAWATDPVNERMLCEADCIVLERQMVLKFQAVNHCIRFRHWDKTIEVAPATMAKLFGLPGTRKEKKKAAVELVGKNAVFPVKKGKKDDLADAFLLAAHGLFLASPNLKDQWVSLANEPSTSRRSQSNKRKSRSLHGAAPAAPVKRPAQSPASEYIYTLDDDRFRLTFF